MFASFKLPVGVFAWALLVFSTAQSDFGQANELSSIQATWAKPPREAGVRCWWWWLNGNVTKAAITKDLEAMHDKGFSGGIIFDADGSGQRGNLTAPEGPMFASPEWTELYLHALSEAERLDLTLGLSIQSGWNLGGPRVTLEHAAKQVTWSEVKLTGPAEIKQRLPQPKQNFGYYRDIRVLAWPYRPQSEQRQPIRDLAGKTAAIELGSSAPDCRHLLNDHPALVGEHDALLADVIDLTDKVDEDGKLTWSVPDGDWVVLRVGYTPTTAHVSTSSGKWQGRVVDYLSTAAFDTYWYDTVDPLLKKAGSKAGTVLTHLETDSWECGGMNWTPRFEQEFKNFNGYDMAAFLPVVAGKIIENREVSNAFLADFRKTIAHCISENHYKLFAKRAAEYGLGTQPECSGPHAGPLDGITNYSHSSIAMSEFWSPSPHRPMPGNRFYVKQASSAAHIYGIKYVGAESFTTIGPHWNDRLWYSQKPALDYSICEGLNLVFFHTFTCSPPEMGLPGQEYFAGTHINPQVTWWDESQPFMDYINRVQHLVQQGEFVADVLYYYGDHVPNIAVAKFYDRPKALPGYDFDVTNEDVLLKLKVVDGRLVTPGGTSYRLLALPDHKVLSLAALKKVKQVLLAGAKVVGPKSERLVSRVGGDAAQKEFRQIADELWGSSPVAEGMKSVGDGVLAWGLTSWQILNDTGIPQDFKAVAAEKASDYEYIHYKVGDDHVYFVCNQTPEPRKLNLSFRMTDHRPEFWDPATGAIFPAKEFRVYEKTTEIPVAFSPHGSMFVVFRNTPSGSKKVGENFTQYHELQPINGPWDVIFDPRWGGPASPVRFDKLTSWIDHDDANIKYYSGKATYRTTFEVDKLPAGGDKVIELGDVRDVGIARVSLNGEDLGVVWLPPFRVDATKALKPGQNKLEVLVVNSWQNRMLGEDGLPAERRLTKSNIQVTKKGKFKWSLEDSGLLGPVRIVTTQD